MLGARGVVARGVVARDVAALGRAAGARRRGGRGRRRGGARARRLAGARNWLGRAVLPAGGRRGSGGRGGGWRRGRRRGSSSGRLLRAGGIRARLVVGEETPPRPVYGAGVGLVALIKLVDEPLIGPEVCSRSSVR